jgi:TonB family protein
MPAKTMATHSAGVNVTIWRSAFITLILAGCWLACMAQQPPQNPSSVLPRCQVAENNSGNNAIQMLTPTDGVDFNPYLSRLLAAVKRAWYSNIPEEGRRGEKGKVVVQFKIRKDGTLADKEAKTVCTSGHPGLDDSAIGSIQKSAPFEHFPDGYDRDSVTLRFIFLYNLPMEKTTK